jgi:exoribonuclease R
MAENKKEISGLVNTSEEKKPQSKPNKLTLKMQQEKDREPVKGVFKYHENQGGVLKFSIKLYKEDQVETYELVDGGIYTLPRGVATHLNKNTYYPLYEHSRVAKDVSGIPELKIKHKIFRTGFYPLDFVDVGDEEQRSTIITMER